MLEKIFQVSYYAGVSLQQLLEKIKAEASSALPVPRAVAVAVAVQYQLTGTAWRKYAADPVAHHIRNPGAHALLDACVKALTQAGYLSAGQVVTASTSKFIDDTDTNVLKVTINQVTEPLKEDKDFPLLKIIKWYENWCIDHKTEPKLKQFRSIYKAIFKKQTKLSFDPTKVDFLDKIPVSEDTK
jgi:hypothetical protein